MNRLTLLSLFIVSIGLPGCAATNHPLERHKEVVRLNAQAFNERDRSLLAATTHPKIVRHSQATPGLIVESREDLMAFFESDWASFPDSHIEITHMAAEVDLVGIFGRYTGRQDGQIGPFPPSGKELDLDFGAVFRIEDNQIAEIWVTWDNMTALTQLGHLQPPE